MYTTTIWNYIVCTFLDGKENIPLKTIIKARKFLKVLLYNCCFAICITINTFNNDKIIRGIEYPNSLLYTYVLKIIFVIV